MQVGKACEFVAGQSFYLLNPTFLPRTLLAMAHTNSDAEIAFALIMRAPHFIIRATLNFRYKLKFSYVRFLFIPELMLRVRLTLGVRSFLQSISRLLKLATKPGRSELWQSVKICLLGIGLIGVIGFIIKLISFVLSGL